MSPEIMGWISSTLGLLKEHFPWLKRVHALAAVEILMFSKC